jgi:hypothetical protein
MYASCKYGKFPSIETMCEYGLSGFGGTNPLDIFEQYQGLVKQGVQENKLTSEMGQILKVPPVQYFECRICGFYSSKKKCTCEKNQLETIEPVYLKKC